MALVLIAGLLAFAGGVAFLAETGWLLPRHLAETVRTLLPASAGTAPAEALRTDPANPYKWCDLAEALAASGQREKAEYAVSRAVRLGGSLPPILMRAANVRFRNGETEAALTNTSRILQLGAEYDEIVFSYYRRLGVPAPLVLKRGLPGDERARHSYFRHLLGWGAPEDTALTWSALAEDSRNTDELAGAYVHYLLQRRMYDRAVKVWAEQLGDRRRDYPDPNRLFNGSFEMEPTGTALDWQIIETEGASATRVPESFSGDHALKLQFFGTHNIGYRHMGQTACLRPGNYRFRAFVRTQGLSTDQGVYFRIFDPDHPGQLDIRTARLSGTNDWTPLEATFSAGSQTPQVRVQLRRDESMKIDSRISGSAWIDAVTLSR